MVLICWKIVILIHFLVGFIDSFVMKNKTEIIKELDEQDDLKPKEGIRYFLDDNGELQLANLSGSDSILNGRRVNERAKIQFFLYTTKNPTEPFQLYVDDMETLKESPFNPRFPTKTIIHGFSNTYLSPFSQSIKDAYIDTGKYNVIVVNWGSLCKPPFYYSASKNTMTVGKYVAKFVDMLVNNTSFKLSNLHIIGHSLGAHTAGIVGKHLTTGKVKRITALDPAYPLYELARKKWIVTENDAEFVDVIHTSGDDLGFMEPLGHVDFYPNSGVASQPGCGFDLTASCSHSRSWEYFSETIYNNVGFPTRECETLRQVKKGKCDTESENTPYMGEKAYNIGSATGLYFTKTNKRKPFAINQP